MKALLINNIDTFPLSADDIDNFFDDNGGEPDGNAWIIPIEKLPANFDAAKYGEIIEVQECKYIGDNQDNNLDVDGKKWIGFSSRDIAFISH